MANTAVSFALARSLPPDISSFDICAAAEKVAGRGNIWGAQNIGALWRIYTTSERAKITLVAHGIDIQGRNVNLSAQNPFIVRGSDGQEIPATRLTISDLPASVADRALENALLKLGVKFRSRMEMERIRDPQGKLTEWHSGRRFVWIDLPKSPLPKKIEVTTIKASLYYREMKLAGCGRCFGQDHRTRDCPNEELCLLCRRPGHKKRNCPKNESHGQEIVGSEIRRDESNFPSLRRESEEMLSDRAEAVDESDENEEGWMTVGGRSRRSKRRKAHKDLLSERLYGTDDDSDENGGEEEYDDEKDEDGEPEDREEPGSGDEMFFSDQEEEDAEAEQIINESSKSEKQDGTDERDGVETRTADVEPEREGESSPKEGSPATGEMETESEKEKGVPAPLAKSQDAAEGEAEEDGEKIPEQFGIGERIRSLRKSRSSVNSESVWKVSNKKDAEPGSEASDAADTTSSLTEPLKPRSTTQSSLLEHFGTRSPQVKRAGTLSPSNFSQEAQRPRL